MKHLIVDTNVLITANGQADSDWREFQKPLERHQIKIRFLCKI